MKGVLYEPGDIVLISTDSSSSRSNLPNRFLCKILNKYYDNTVNDIFYKHEILYTFKNCAVFYEAGKTNRFAATSTNAFNSRKINTNDVDKTIKIIKVLFEDV